jgi:predicted DNA-binding transcriptional regulator AlpA
MLTKPETISGLTVFVEFKDLAEAKIVMSWPQLRRLQERSGFPKGVLLGERRRAFPVAEVNAWLAKRPTENPEFIEACREIGRRSPGRRGQKKAA